MKQDGRDLLAEFREAGAGTPADRGSSGGASGASLLIVAALLVTCCSRADGRRAVLPDAGDVDDADVRHRAGDAADGPGGADRDPSSRASQELPLGWSVG